jgi:hypothetical protein
MRVMCCQKAPDRPAAYQKEWVNSRCSITPLHPAFVWVQKGSRGTWWQPVHEATCLPYHLDTSSSAGPRQILRDINDNSSRNHPNKLSTAARGCKRDEGGSEDVGMDQVEASGADRRKGRQHGV